MLRIPHQCEKVFRYHRLILVMAVIFTVLGALLARKLPLKSDLDALLPDSSPSVQAMERMRQEVGSSGRFRLVLEGSDFAAMTRLAHDLEPRLVASPMVQYVDYQNDVGFYRKHALLFLEPAELDSLQDAIQQAVDDGKQSFNPLMVDDLFGDASATPDASVATATDELADWETKYSDLEPRPYYTNADSTVLVMDIFPVQANSSLESVRGMLANVQAIVDSVGPTSYDPGMQVYYGGSLKNRLEEYDVIKRDILGTALYGVAGVFLLIALFFRRLSGAILVSLSLAMALCWTFGITYLVIGELNTITGFMVVILFGLGIDYGVHTFARYAEARSAGFSVQQAIDQMVCQTGTAVATTAITTAAAFFLLMFMDFKGFAHLGFIAGVGVLFSFVAMVMVLPSMLMVGEQRGWLHFAPKADRPVRPPPARGSLPWARAALVGGIALTAVALVLASRVEFEYDFTNLRAISAERELVGDKTAGVFTLSESPAVVLADTPAEVAEIVAAVNETRRADTVFPTVARVRSIFSLVPDDQEVRLAKIREIRTLVETEAQGALTGDDARRLERLEGYLQVDAPFTWADFPESDKRQFINTSGEVGNFVFIYPSVPLRDGRNAIEFRNDIGTITTPSGQVFHAASTNLIAAEMLVLMLSEGRWAAGLSLLLVALLVWSDFRSVRGTLLVMLPLVVAFIWAGGMMFLLGMKVNFYNMVVFPSIVGIGVDNGVHLFHRYLEEGSGSLPLVVRKTGWAILITTLTTVVGYSGLVAAHHPGLQSMGLVAVIGLISAFIAAVVLLPSVVQFLEKRKALPVEGLRE